MPLSKLVFYCKVCKRKFHDNTAFHFHKKWSHTFESENSLKNQLEETFSIEVNNAFKDQFEETISIEVDNCLKDKLEETISIESIYSLKDKVEETFSVEFKNTLKEQNKDKEDSNDYNEKLKIFLNSDEQIIWLKETENKENDEISDQENSIEDPLMSEQPSDQSDKHFPQDKPNQIKCHLGNENFSQKKTYYDEQPHKKGFKRNKNLKFQTKAIHEKQRSTKAIHEKQRTYSCEKCKQSFSEKQMLKFHILDLHKTNKPYLCHLCPTSVSNERILKSHIKEVHETSRNFKCRICETNFKRKNCVTRHINLVHKKLQTYECSICFKKFGKIDHVKRHTKNIHEKY